MNFKISWSISMKNPVDILSGIALYLYRLILRINIPIIWDFCNWEYDHKQVRQNLSTNNSKM